jgi:GTP-binding protein
MARETVKKGFDCEFTGSFFHLDQLPKDRRLQVAIAGRSNVGKSSLLNRLVGQKKLAKISSTPGKTRSINFFLVDNKFYFVDLPGYGYAKVARKVRENWGRLLEEYLEQSRRLAGLVLLLDCRREITEEDMELVGWLADRGLPTLAVVTKADKLSRDKVNRKVRAVESQLGIPAIPFSVVTGQGKKELFGAIQDLIATKNKRTKV